MSLYDGSYEPIITAGGDDSMSVPADRVARILGLRPNVRSVADIETVLDMLYAPVFYRLLVGHLPLTEKFGRTVVDNVWRALAAKE